LKSCNKLPLVDGQHRQKGFEYAINEKGLTQFADYEVPVVIMLDIDKLGEMRQFNTVNGTQKSVRTDLVNMILTQLAEQEGEDAVAEAEHWKVIVSHAIMRLNEDPGGPWFDRIILPGRNAYSKDEVADVPELRHLRTARATSFMTALKPVEQYASEHITGNPTLDERAGELFEVVDAFWRAVRSLNPECFDHADDYVMLKTPGIFSLHKLCRWAMQDLHRARRDWTEENFKEYLSGCEEISNPGFWRVQRSDGTGGDAAKYGSMKGFAELAGLLYESLQAA
jgi:DGQHR domain-containing protein